MYTDESLIAFCQRALQTPSFSGRERQTGRFRIYGNGYRRCKKGYSKSARS